MALQSLDIKRRSVTSTITSSPGVHKPIEVAGLIDVSNCVGYKTYQVACPEWSDIRDEIGTNYGVYDNPIDLVVRSRTVTRFSETGENGKLEWLIRGDGYIHYADPGCLKACPSPGAIIQYQNDIVDFHQENCIGCRYCIADCPFNIPRLNKEDNCAYKCILCSNHIVVGQEPVYVKTYPTGVIQFGSKEGIKAMAQGRVEDLNRRGYKNASLYDPQGIGSTHMTYVLHHADELDLYHGLPEDPSVSKTAKLWRGFLKPLATSGIAVATLTDYFHYITVGPNHAVEDGEEPEAIGKDGKTLSREEDA